MANYATLKAAIQAVIKTNGNEEITGSVLQQSLLAMITSLGADYQFVGVAQEDTSPGTPDQNVFYICGPGTFPNFGAVTIPDGYIGILKYNGSWTSNSLQVGKDYDASISALQELVAQIQMGNLLSPGPASAFPGYDGMVSGIIALRDNDTFTSNSYYNIYWFRVNNDCIIDYVTGLYTLNAAAIVVSDALPALNGSYTKIADMVAGQSGSFSVRAGKYVGCVCYGTDSNFLPRSLTIRQLVPVNVLTEIQTVDDKISSFYKMRNAALASTYFHGVRLVDTMTQQLWGKSTATKIGNFIPVSANQNSITLSAADAACIVNTVILSCKMSDGKYYNVYFSAASGNVITKLYDFGRDINCANIVEMQSLHDTVNGDGGIHLSPYGYRAMAQMVCDKLQTKEPFSDVFVGGWSSQFCQAAADYLDSVIKDANGVTICTPILDGITVGGATNRCQIQYVAAIPTNGPIYNSFYEITQAAPNGANATFRINADYPFKGFLRINCSREPGYDGAVSLTIKDFDGNTKGTKVVAQYADSYIFELNDKYYSGVDVIVTMPDNTLSRIKITEMTLHETYIDLVQIRPINSKSVVALLGSSNTQFPHLDTAEALCPGDPDNEIVERPDGTFGDGCGYFGKQIARITGATVDNWGKSGEQTPYGLETIEKVFATKRYTHIILSLFANDANANRPWAEIISNIRQMAEYAKGQGCVPIVIMGYTVNTATPIGASVPTSQGIIRYSLMYNDLTQGMDSPFIYTNAELHLG